MAIQREGEDLAGELACPVFGELLDELGERARVAAALLSLVVGPAVPTSSGGEAPEEGELALES